MKNTKKLIAVVLVMAMIASSMIFSVNAAETRTISVGETVSVTTDEEVVFEFIPEESGCYAFFSESEACDPVASIKDSDGNVLDSCDDRNVGDFNYRVGLQMEAGEVYYLYTRLLSADELFYTVTCERVPLATGFELVPAVNTGSAPGSYTAFIITPIPEGSYCPPLSFSTDNESVAVVEGSDAIAVSVLYTGVGTATITGRNENGMSASVTVEVEMPPYISLEELTIVSVTEDAPYVDFAFVPEESGYYQAVAHGNYFIEIFESSAGNIASGSYSDEAGGTSAGAYMEAGKTYYIKTGSDERVEASYSFGILPAAVAESIEIEVGAYRGVLVGEEIFLRAVAVPDGTVLGDLEWSVSGDGVSFESAGEFAWLTFAEEGSATVTVENPAGLSASVTLETMEIREIALDEIVDVDVADTEDFGLDAVFSFVPEESGSYVFMSTGDGPDPVGDIRGNGVDVGNDDSNGLDFAVHAYLTAGETYLLFASSHSGEGSYSVSIKRSYPAEAVYLVSHDGETGYVGRRANFGVDFGDPMAAREDFEIYIDNGEAAVVRDIYNESFTVEYLSAGTVNIYVVSESGLVSETVTVEVTEIEKTPIELDCEYQVDHKVDETVFFTFTPEETGEYTFFSYGNNGDPAMSVYNSEGDEIGGDDDSRGAGNFIYTDVFYEGETYQIELRRFGEEETITYSVMVVKYTECEEIVIDAEENCELFAGDYRAFLLECHPFGSFDRIADFAVDDPSVLAVTYYNGLMLEIYGESAGSATVTVYTENGLEASLTVTVVEREEEPFILGDINEDGVLNGRDGNIMKRILSGSEIIEYDMAVADVVEDGELNGKDANYLSRMIAGAV